MSNTTWGAHISSDIENQITQRGNLFKKEGKTEQELVCIHSNGAWISLRSGIDDPNNNGSAYAKKYRLLGSLGQNRMGVNLVPENLNDSTGNFAYNVYTDTGFKAMPGITSLTVKAKDTYGCIREAIVSFKVFSLEDLNIIDRIYFKPGFTMLIEWGHTAYVDNDGKVQFVNSSPISDSEFFEKDRLTLEKVDELISNRRKDSCGNYDGLFGLVTNFNYKFNKDGSYDCSLTTLSRGSVLEGLTIYAPILPTSGSADNKDTLPKTIWNTVSDVLKKYESKKSSDKVEVVDSDASSKLERPCTIRPSESFTTTVEGTFDGSKALDSVTGDFYKKLKGLPSFYVVCKKVSIKKGILGFRNNEEKLHYLRLRDLLWLITRLNTPKKKNVNIQFDLRSSNRYIRPEECISFNPYIAVSPNNTKGIFNTEDAGLKWHEPFILPSIKKDGYDTDEDLDINLENDRNNILNIYVNLDYVCDIINSKIDTEQKEYKIWDVIIELLGGIQKAFGNINDFQLVTNQEIGDDVFTIVDTNCHEDLQDSMNWPEFTLTGLSSTFKDITAESKITDSVVNSMAIAASAGGATSGDVNGMVVAWNEGCVDRYLIEENSKEPVSTTDNNGEEQEVLCTPPGIMVLKSQLESFTEKIVELYRKLNTKISQKDGPNTSEFVESSFTDLQVLGEQFYNKLVNRELKDKGDGPCCNAAMPVQLDFTLKGLGRFVIGTSFKLGSRVFPSKYNDWAFIITGVEHSVNRSGWITSLRTQCYPTTMQNIMQDTTNTDSTATATQVESMIAPDQDNEVCKDCVEAANKAASFVRTTTSTSNCARYTYQIAKNYVTGENAASLGHAGGNADEATYWNNLKALSYTESYSINLTKSNLQKILAERKFNVGDVVVYRSKGSNLRARVGKAHTCFFTGTQWVSDFIQARAFVYSNPKYNYPDWELKIFTGVKGGNC